jgi:MFS family permease
MSTAVDTPGRIVHTNVPARLDRLPWSRWHWRVVIALGITWIIDGLEVTLVGTVVPVLQDPQTLHLTPAQLGGLNSAYLVGAVLGALVFGYLTDRLGRKKLFFVTLAVYLVGALLSAFSWDFWSFALFRFITGAGIGGEYSAINSAIDELIPARVRGWADLAINGTFWVGAATGNLAALLLLDRRLLPIDLGWRLGFGIGAALGLGILFMRRFIPESPRWMITHGQADEAEEVVAEVEREIKGEGKALPAPEGTIAVREVHVGFGQIAETMLRTYPTRTVLGLALIVAQAFLYNGVSFTFGLVLVNFYGIAENKAGLYLLPFALTNFLGPLLLGRLFDTVGRRPMIAGTYAVSAGLLVLSGLLSMMGVLGPASQTALWALIFFFASAAASSAYLTVSEIFPVEMRGLVIALFYAVGTAIGGPAASWLFGELIETGSATYLFYGYLGAAVLLLITVGIVLKYGVKAEGSSLEAIAEPLSAAREAA